MGRRGTKRLTQAELERRGSQYANRNPDAPTPMPGRPKCPKDLDSLARSVWRKLMPILLEAGTVTIVDGAKAARYCQLHIIWQKTMKQIENLTEFAVKYTDTQGNTFMRDLPHIQRLLNLNIALGRIESEYGLDPSSRNSIVLPERAITRRKEDLEDRERLKVG